MIHGQVVEAWLPSLRVQRIVVADEEATHNPLLRAAMGLAVPGTIELFVQPPGELDWSALAADERRTLVLFRELPAVNEAREKGLRLVRLNLGNIHFAQGKRQVSPSVFLSMDELELLAELRKAGVEVEARAVPNERPTEYAEMVEQGRRGA